MSDTAEASGRKKTKRNRLSLTKQKAERRSAAEAAGSAAAAGADSNNTRPIGGDNTECDAMAQANDGIGESEKKEVLPVPPAPAARLESTQASTGDDGRRSDETPAQAKSRTTTTTTTTTTRTTHPPPPYARHYVDPDALAAYQLRTRLAADVPFLHAWPVMEAQGWRHRDARYYAPGTGECLGSAIECFRRLDEEGGMPPPGAAAGGGAGMDGAAEHGVPAGARRGGSGGGGGRSMRKLRDDLLEGYYRCQHFRAREKEQGRRRRRRRAGRADSRADGDGEPGQEDNEAGKDADQDQDQAAPKSGKYKSNHKDDHDDHDHNNDDDHDSLRPALFGLDSEMSDTSPSKQSPASTVKTTSSRNNGSGAGDKAADAPPATTRGSEAPRPPPKRKLGGGGDRGAEEYLRNKVGMPTATAGRPTRGHKRRGAAAAAAAAEEPAATRARDRIDDASTGSNDDDQDDGSDHGRAWPTLGTNVAAVREHAVSISSETGVQALDENCASSFDEWRFLLSTNHSVLLYGFGSKRSLLNDFAETILPHDGDVLTLDGYDRTINVEEIFMALVHLYLGGHEPRPRLLAGTGSRIESGTGSRATVDASALGLGVVPPTPGSAASVRRAFAIAERIGTTRTVPIYIVLHNIDGVGLRYRQTQEALAMLVAASIGADGNRMIRLVSSLDHVNTPATLWSTQTRAAFGWIWKEVHTYRPSFEEVRLGGEEGPVRKTRYGLSSSGSRVTSSSSGDGMGFMRVLESIGKRHAEALQVLAKEQYKLQKEQDRKHQQKRRGKPPQLTISYNSWKKLCIGKMCASDETGLRIMLTELTDHGIIAAKNLDDGRHLFIPHDLPVLKQILRFKPDAD